MKRCQILPFGTRLNRKCDQLIKMLDVYPFLEATELLQKIVSITENVYWSSNNFTELSLHEAINVGILAQLSEDNIYFKCLNILHSRLLIIASDLHEAGIIFDQLLEELERLTHKSTLKV